MLEYLNLFILPAVLVIAASYLLGSISFSIIFTKFFQSKDTDIRDMGSGNAGATNVLRSVGPKAAALTFLFDFLKCVASVLVGRMVFSYVCGLYDAPSVIAQYGAYIAGIACLLGHIFPIYYGFRGGKGVVTCAAMAALLDWRVFVICIVLFIITFACSKMVSLGSIIALSAFPVVTFLITYFIDYKNVTALSHGPVPLSYVITVTALSLVIGLVVDIKHHTNISRIKNGTEKKITFGKKDK